MQADVVSLGDVIIFMVASRVALGSKNIGQ